MQPDGTPNTDFFAIDCFHFSQYGNAVVAKNLWNNIVQVILSMLYSYRNPTVILN